MNPPSHLHGPHGAWPGRKLWEPPELQVRSPVERHPQPFPVIAHHPTLSPPGRAGSCASPIEVHGVLGGGGNGKPDSRIAHHAHRNLHRSQVGIVSVGSLQVWTSEVISDRSVDQGPEQALRKRRFMA